VTPPRLMPGAAAWLKTTNGGVIGPLTIASVEITLSVAGRFDRFRFDFCPKLGHAAMFPFEESRVFATREEAEG
jgi:hypothetical protein